MTDETSVSDLRAFVSSLELVISSLVVTHQDKALLASKLAEVALSLHTGSTRAGHVGAHASDASYEMVMGYARMAKDALGHDYQSAGERRSAR